MMIFWGLGEILFGLVVGNWLCLVGGLKLDEVLLNFLFWILIFVVD